MDITHFFDKNILYKVSPLFPKKIEDFYEKHTM